MRKPGTSLLVSLFLLALTVSAFAGDEWLSEFEDIASRTEESGTMSKDELTAIIERCDKLRPVVEKSDNPQKNVILFRLDKTKKLYLFVLESQ